MWQVRDACGVTRVAVLAESRTGDVHEADSGSVPLSSHYALSEEEGERCVFVELSCVVCDIQERSRPRTTPRLNTTYSRTNLTVCSSLMRVYGIELPEAIKQLTDWGSNESDDDDGGDEHVVRPQRV